MTRPDALKVMEIIAACRTVRGTWGDVLREAHAARVRLAKAKGGKRAK